MQELLVIWAPICLYGGSTETSNVIRGILWKRKTYATLKHFDSGGNNFEKPLIHGRPSNAVIPVEIKKILRWGHAFSPEMFSFW